MDEDLPIPRPASDVEPSPSKMARHSLSFEPTTPACHIDRLINSNHHSSPSRTILGDRFIPSRTFSNFSLFNVLSSPSSSSSSSSLSSGTKPEDSSNAYTTLLRAALFGPEAGSPFPGTPPKVSGSLPPNRNIFRFKTETKRPMPSLMPFGRDDSLPGVSYSPVKSPRKVPKSPYKVNFVDNVGLWWRNLDFFPAHRYWNLLNFGRNRWDWGLGFLRAMWAYGEDHL